MYITEKDYENLHVSTLDNLDEMDKLQETQNQPRLNYKETELVKRLNFL